MKRRFQLPFITLVVLEIFIPSILAGLCYVDDVQMVHHLLQMGDWSLKSIFTPGGIYYRPLLSLSFILDKELWSLNEHIMHLENVLIHLLNVAIVYKLALTLLPDKEKEESRLPLVAALCFGLHPLNTESVNWISGRTDVMAGTFVFLSALYLVKFKQENRKRFLAVSTLSLLLGILTKEVALAFLPGAFFMLIAEDTDQTSGQGTYNKYHDWLRILLLLLIILAVPVLLYFQMRSHDLSTDAGRLGKTIMQMSNDPGQALFVCLRAFGFYMKKLYLPLPLDLTIREVDPLYELLALPFLLLALLLLGRRTLVTAIYLAGILLITPSLLIAFDQIAWTPYAERYVYVASAFIIIPSAFFLNRQLECFRQRTLIKAGVSALLVTMAMFTLQRNIYWMKTTAPYQKVKHIVEKKSER